MKAKVLLGAAIVGVWVLSVSEREAAAATKEECVEAHGRGQDQKEKAQLAKARQSFLTCAQSTCPSLIQGDCAKFSEELSHLVPTVSFGARDSVAGDVPNTSVYVDDVLLSTRLDDGKSYEIDPGKHVVRYAHEGKETTLRVVVNQGEKGRLLLATFESKEDARKPLAAPPPVLHEEKRSAVPLVLAGVGAAALVTGGVLFTLGVQRVPSNCSIGSHECTGGPASSMDDAQKGMKLANVGLGVGVAGAVVLASGLIWHFAEPKKEGAQARAFDGVLHF